MRYIDKNTYASEPGGICLSDAKWKELRGMLCSGIWQCIGFNRRKKKIAEYLCYGDTQPALVISEVPFRIAAYSDEMDAVVILEFPPMLREKYGLKTGDRLTTSNTYTSYADYHPVEREETADDIFPGQGFLKRYTDVSPIVQIFLSDEEDRIEEHRQAVPEELWAYVTRLAREYTADRPDIARDGLALLL